MVSRYLRSIPSSWIVSGIDFHRPGAKDDRRDARVLADAVRTDPGCLRRLDPIDAEIIQLREWSRMADELTTQRTRLTHQVRAQLWRYFPQFLKLGFPLYSAVLRDLWTLIPTPARVRLVSVEKVLKRHRIRRINAEQVLQILRTTPVPVADGVQEATTANLRLQSLALIQAQLQEAKGAMEAILETLSTEVTPTPVQVDSESATLISEHEAPSDGPALRDADILASLPGVGTTVLATLLSEAPGLIKARDHRGLRSFCGVAPVTRQSGKTRRVVRRQAYLAHLSNAVYHWSRVAVQHDPVSKAKYKALRERNHTHGRALRSVADRLLAVDCAMLRDGTRYDPSRATVTP